MNNRVNLSLGPSADVSRPQPAPLPPCPENATLTPVFASCLRTETLTAGLREHREKVKFLQNPESGRVAFSLLLGDQFATVPLRYLLSQLFVNFRPLLDPVMKFDRVLRFGDGACSLLGRLFRLYAVRSRQCLDWRRRWRPSCRAAAGFSQTRSWCRACGLGQRQVSAVSTGAVPLRRCKREAAFCRRSHVSGLLERVPATWRLHRARI